MRDFFMNNTNRSNTWIWTSHKLWIFFPLLWKLLMHFFVQNLCLIQEYYWKNWTRMKPNILIWGMSVTFYFKSEHSKESEWNRLVIEFHPHTSLFIYLMYHLIKSTKYSFEIQSIFLHYLYSRRRRDRNRFLKIVISTQMMLF